MAVNFLSTYTIILSLLETRSSAQFWDAETLSDNKEYGAHCAAEADSRSEIVYGILFSQFYPPKAKSSIKLSSLIQLVASRVPGKNVIFC